MPEQYWSLQHIRIGICLLNLMKLSHALNLMRHSPRFNHLPSNLPPNPMPVTQPHAMNPQILTEQCMLLISQSFRTLPSPPTVCLLCAWLCFASSDLCVGNIIVHLEPIMFFQWITKWQTRENHYQLIHLRHSLCIYANKPRVKKQFWLPSWIVCSVL